MIVDLDELDAWLAGQRLSPRARQYAEECLDNAKTHQACGRHDLVKTARDFIVRLCETGAGA